MIDGNDVVVVVASPPPPSQAASIFFFARVVVIIITIVIFLFLISFSQEASHCIPIRHFQLVPLEYHYCLGHADIIFAVFLSFIINIIIGRSIIAIGNGGLRHLNNELHIQTILLSLRCCISITTKHSIEFVAPPS